MVPEKASGLRQQGCNSFDGRIIGDIELNETCIEGPSGLLTEFGVPGPDPDLLALIDEANAKHRVDITHASQNRVREDRLLSVALRHSINSRRPPRAMFT